MPLGEVAKWVSFQTDPGRDPDRMNGHYENMYIDIVGLRTSVIIKATTPFSISILIIVFSQSFIPFPPVRHKICWETIWAIQVSTCKTLLTICIFIAKPFIFITFIIIISVTTTKMVGIVSIALAS